MAIRHLGRIGVPLWSSVFIYGFRLRAMPKRVAAGAAILLTALGYFLATGTNDVWPLAWIAPVPILLYAFTAPPRATLIAAFLAYLFGSLSYFSALRPIISLLLLFFALVVPAAVFACVILATRRAVLRFDHWAAVFAFPVLWTAWDQLWPYNHLAYSQADFLPLIQIASVTGPSGVAFLLALAASGIALAWHLRRRRGAAAALIIPSVLCALVIAWGWMRMAHPPSRPPVRIGLAATDETIRYFRTQRSEEALPVIAAYARRVGDLAGRGAEVVVLPEKFVGIAPAYAREARQILAAAARTHHVAVIAGFNQLESPAPRNLAVVFTPEGEIQTEYAKVLLVPGFEDNYQPGDRLGILPPTPGHQGTWGVAICRDLLFPELGRKYGRAGVGLMLIPAWDFVTDGPIEARITRLRAVEGGFAVARAAQEGVPLVVDPYGRVVAQAPTHGQPEVLIVADVVPGSGATIYSRTGDWFGWLNVIGAVVLLALNARRTTTDEH